MELYVHIPFCVKKCEYCDFLSFSAGSAAKKMYTDALQLELKSAAAECEGETVSSVFLGGGTPSVLEKGQIGAIMERIQENYQLSEDCEISMEANPGTLNPQKLKEYHQCGINRLSLGCQSTIEEELKNLGRIHSFEEFVENYEMARSIGFSNINVDLMSAIPRQDVKSWEKNLRTIAVMEPEHISAYSLIVEEGTPFYEEYGEGRHADELPDEETERKMYWRTKEILSKYGYERYEISNYAKPGYACRHNIGYWERTEYLGIGTGAASLINNSRFNYGEEPEKLTVSAQMEETMFLGLRMMKGVSKIKFLKMYGESMENVYGNVIRDMEQKGLLEDGEDFVKLTDRGLDVSNYVMSEFLL